MATRPHATTEEQVAALGKIRRKPVQIDLLTGDLVTKPPKRGSGSHIALKPTGFERPAIPGMASWAGGGPEGKRCEHCIHLGAVTIQRPNSDIERSSAACLRYCQRTGHLPSVRRDITLERACNQFSEGESPKAWLIDWAGRTHSPDWRDRSGVPRFHHLNEHENPDNPGHILPRRRA